MRSNNKYIQKVQEELDVYRNHLLFEGELNSTQQQVFDKVIIARGWLKQGYSDSKVLDLLRTDPQTKLQERRAREVMAIAYELFADIRLNRNADGIKLLYAEMFKDAAEIVLKEAKSAFNLKERKEGADLMKTYKSLLSEAANLDGAYREKTDISGKKKPTKVSFSRTTKIVDGQKEDDFTQKVEYEVNP